jgi:hypothetical protein
METFINYSFYWSSVVSDFFKQKGLSLSEDLVDLFLKDSNELIVKLLELGHVIVSHETFLYIRETPQGLVNVTVRKSFSENLDLISNFLDVKLMCLHF